MILEFSRYFNVLPNEIMQEHVKEKIHELSTG